MTAHTQPSHSSPCFCFSLFKSLLPIIFLLNYIKLLSLQVAWVCVWVWQCVFAEFATPQSSKRLTTSSQIPSH